MDVVAWIVFTVAGCAAAVAVLLAPRLRRDNLRRQLAGGGGSYAGIGAGFDSVWRPSAEDAHAQWDAQIELPAPAPTPGDGGTIDDGVIVIEVRPQR